MRVVVAMVGSKRDWQSSTYSRDDLRDKMAELLRGGRSMTKHDIRRKLRGTIFGDADTHDINSVLYNNNETFVHDGSSLPRWSLHSPSVVQRSVPPSRHVVEPPREPATRPAPPAVPPDPPIRQPPSVTPAIPSIRTVLDPVTDEEFVMPQYYGGHPPRDWQREAYVSWRESGLSATVEAVTGTGKTTLGALAAALAASHGRETLVLVPSKELLSQWYAVLCRDLPDLRIGRLGDGHRDTFRGFFRRHDVIVAIINSAAADGGRFVVPRGGNGLLIADEVHRYGAPTWSRALRSEYDWRLGLTATYERSDDGLESILRPYFSETQIDGCSYARGLADGILAPFTVGLVPVDLAPHELEEYQELDSRLKKSMGALIHSYNCPAQPWGEFMKSVARLAEGGRGDYQATNLARRYQSDFHKRRALIAESQAKHSRVMALSSVARASHGTLMFAETKNAAGRIAHGLQDRGVIAAMYTSDTKPSERERLLAQFKAGSIDLLATAKLLKEGVDLPEADVAVIVAASSSRLEMIQRMGRVIRPKSDGRSATFLILYNRETNEDPALGAHEVFLSEMLDNAQEVVDLGGVETADEFLDWYLNRVGGVIVSTEPCESDYDDDDGRGDDHEGAGLHDSASQDSVDDEGEDGRPQPGGSGDEGRGDELPVKGYVSPLVQMFGYLELDEDDDDDEYEDDDDEGWWGHLSSTTIWAIAVQAKKQGQLSPRERHFLGDMARAKERGWDLTPKQEEWLCHIILKVRQLRLVSPSTTEGREIRLVAETCNRPYGS